MKPFNPEFTEPDLVGRSLFGYLKSRIGFRTSRQILGLALAVCVPLIIFWIVTTHENRFVLGSLFTESTLGGKSFHLVGMSFLGDPMVWGFTFLVPFLIAVLDLATKRTVLLINASAAKATPEWRQDASSRGFARAVSRSKQIWRMRSDRHPAVMKFLRYGPWAVAIIFWMYNGISCAFLDFPPLPNPYTSDRVTLISSDGNAQPDAKGADGNKGELSFTFAGRAQTIGVSSTNAKRVVELSERAPLRKWDCERAIAPWSFWLTRVWTAFFYGALPFLVRQLLLLVWGATSFLQAGRRWEEEHGDQTPALSINPFEPDGFGGLGSLSDAVIIYLYSVSILASLLGLSFLKEGTEPAWHNYATMISFLPFGIWAVLAPSLAVRHAVVGAKNRYLHVLAGHLHRIGDSILAALPDETLTDTLQSKKFDDQKKVIRGLYDDVSKMKEWPFDTTLMLRILASLAAPWLPAALKQISGIVLK